MMLLMLMVIAQGLAGVEDGQARGGGKGYAGTPAGALVFTAFVLLCCAKGYVGGQADGQKELAAPGFTSRERLARWPLLTQSLMRYLQCGYQALALNIPPPELRGLHPRING